jgi:hypothetical protein
MGNYHEDIMRWRIERDQREATERVSQLGEEYKQAVRERDRAIASGENEEAEYQDNVCQDLEREYLKLCPPQPQMDPKAAEWIRRNKAFFDRHGPQADAAVRAAHVYVTRPKIPDETNPARTGMGLRPYTPAYFRAMETALQMHGPDFYGVRYDPSEKALTANEVAKMSGQSADEYNRASQQLARDGRFSWQQK